MISIIILAYIVINESIRRFKTAGKANAKTKMESLLNKFSFITILFCFIKAITLLLFQVQGICTYISPKSDIPIMAILISFTFYQISRFIYCFGDTLIVTFNDNCTYYSIIIIPYIIGSLILLSSLILRILYIDITSKGSYGCDFDVIEPMIGTVFFV